MTNKATAKDYLRLVMSKDVNIREGEFLFSTSCKAHIISLLRHLHSSPDLLAHTVYYCLAFNRNEDTFLEERKITLHQVKLTLKNKSKYKPLSELLDIFTAGDDYKYLQDWGNHTKHRSNVVPNLSYGLVAEGSKAYKFSFEPFKFNGKKHPSKLALDFLNREHDRESEQIILIGVEINKLIANSASSLSPA